MLRLADKVMSYAWWEHAANCAEPLDQPGTGEAALGVIAAQLARNRSDLVRRAIVELLLGVQ